jgi:hypothetical protein
MGNKNVFFFQIDEFHQQKYFSPAIFTVVVVETIIQLPVCLILVYKGQSKFCFWAAWQKIKIG